MCIRDRENKEKDGLFYEQEYLLNGKKRDRDNLHQMVKKLVGVREGLNLIHIDVYKRQENENRDDRGGIEWDDWLKVDPARMSDSGGSF